MLSAHACCFPKKHVARQVNAEELRASGHLHFGRQSCEIIVLCCEYCGFVRGVLPKYIFVTGRREGSTFYRAALFEESWVHVSHRVASENASCWINWFTNQDHPPCTSIFYDWENRCSFSMYERFRLAQRSHRRQYFRPAFVADRVYATAHANTSCDYDESSSAYAFDAVPEWFLPYALLRDWEEGYTDIVRNFCVPMKILWALMDLGCDSIGWSGLRLELRRCGKSADDKVEFDVDYPGIESRRVAPVVGAYRVASKSITHIRIVSELAAALFPRRRKTTVRIGMTSHYVQAEIKRFVDRADHRTGPSWKHGWVNF